jgi:MFS family permease
MSINLTFGQLYRLFDVKIAFCTAVAIFEIGQAVCGAAPSMSALIVGRVIAGLGLSTLIDRKYKD